MNCVCVHKFSFCCLIDYDALRALDAENSPDTPSMSEEQINALPVHKYKGQSHGQQRQVSFFLSILYSGSSFPRFLSFKICGLFIPLVCLYHNAST